jgi:hypothetical protein
MFAAALTPQPSPYPDDFDICRFAPGVPFSTDTPAPTYVDWGSDHERLRRPLICGVGGATVPNEIWALRVRDRESAREVNIAVVAVAGSSRGTTSENELVTAALLLTGTDTDELTS